MALGGEGVAPTVSTCRGQVTCVAGTLTGVQGVCLGSVPPPHITPHPPDWRAPDATSAGACLFLLRTGLASNTSHLTGFLARIKIPIYLSSERGRETGSCGEVLLRVAASQLGE